jgi:hypothetical protein
MAITYPSFTPPKPKVKKPADVFGTPDPTKQLGREAKSGVESQIADISKSVGNVNQRLQQERTTRESGITRQAEEQRQKMARMFGIDAGGLKGGKAIRVAGTIGAQEMQGKENLAGEFGQRVPQEQAQSLQLLQGLQRGQEQADIASSEATSRIELSERAQAFSEYSAQRQMTDAEFNSEVDRQVRSGELNIADKDQLLRQRAQTEAEVSGAFGRSLSQQAQTFSQSLQGQQLSIEQARQQVDAEVARGSLSVEEGRLILDNFIQKGQLNLSTEAQTFAQGIGLRGMSDQEANSAVQRAVAEGSISRDDADQLLRARAQDEIERSNTFNEGLSAKAQAFSESIGLRQMNEQEATGVVERAVANGRLSNEDADQLLRARAQDEAEAQGGFQRKLSQQAQDFSENIGLRQMSDVEANSEVNRAVARGSITRDDADQLLRERQTVIAERDISLQEASQGDDVRLREYALDLQNKIQSGQLTEEQARTQLEVRQVRVQELQQIQQAAAETSRLSMEQTRTDIANVGAALDRAIAQGQVTGEFVDPQTGETRETLQAKAQTHQKELQDKQFDQQVIEASNNFTLGNREADARFKDIEERGKISANELSQRKEEFTRTALQRDNEFIDSMQLSRDEFDELKRKNEAGELDTTKRTDLAYSQFEDMKKARDEKFVSDVAFRDAEAFFQRDVQRAVITGEFEGKTTAAQAQQLWANASEEAQLYGDGPPRLINWNAYDPTSDKYIKGLLYSKKGDPSYDSAYDMDGNGVIENKDMFALHAKAQGNGGLGGGNYMVTDKGRTTLAAQQMLINSSQFQDELSLKLKGVTNDEDRVAIEQQLADDRMTQFRDEIDLRKDDMQRMKNEFATSQTGVISRVDPVTGDLVPQYIQGPSTQNADGSWTPGPWQPATTMSKQNHEQATQRFNRDFNITASQIATRIGAIPSDDGVAIERFWDEVGKDDKIGSVKVTNFLRKELNLSNDQIKIDHTGRMGFRAGNVQEYWDKYITQELNKDPDYRTMSSTEAVNAKRKISADKAREFLVGSLNEQTMGAISGTMAQVVFQGQYAPQAPPPSQAAMIFGQIAGGVAGGLASKSDINSKTDIFPLHIISDIAMKDDITNIATGDDLMERLDAMPVSTWRYKDEPPNIRHLGPMAQHFKKAFNLGNSDKKIDVVDGMGVALTASKHLNGKVKSLNNRIKSLERLVRGKR